MDRRVKERLIGACILVVLVVAVVPELLSGPKPPMPAEAESEARRLPAGAAPDTLRNVTVDLATSKPAVATPEVAPATPQPPVADAASAMVPSGAPPAATASTHSVEQAAPPASTGQSLVLQLGSFANRDNAENLVRQLKAQGYPIYVSAEGSGRAARYRVRVGPLADRDTAERTIAKLKAAGHAANLVKPR